ncbi:MAG: enoyl-CoA hydratase-related protein [Desulfuromonadaceae bacterium]|nr:enoyl-CoA hydratase-related protein [Desulfuromonas sp.]MDY0184542.1 enoyl-CoA hydratase-related protein [Desulfuromonadaceae bacterium]
MGSVNTEILSRKDGAIGTITLNRPQAFNTFTIPFAEQLDAALWDMEHDPTIRVIVIRAEGKNFSAGISLDQFNRKPQREYRDFLYRIDAFYHTLAKLKTVTISEVKGSAMANGAGLAFATDFTIAAKSAKFGTTAINVGLICLGPAVPMMRILGKKRTMEMVLTGQPFSAQHALELGLVNKVVPDELLEEEVQQFVQKLLHKSPLALQIGKEGFNRMTDIPYHAQLDAMDDLFATLCATEDAVEGVSAFLEKRIPAWQGR